MLGVRWGGVKGTISDLQYPKNRINYETTKENIMKNSIQYKEGSGNVFEDLGFIDSEERLAKAKLARCINDIIAKRGLKQIEAAEVLGINQPKVSALINGRLSGFSMERLIRFLNLLNQDVKIVVTPRRGSAQGKLKVAFG